MLRDGGQGDRERFGELADRCRPLRQAGEDPQARWIGERREIASSASSLVAKACLDMMSANYIPFG